MNEKTFSQRTCEEYGLEEDLYLAFTLKKTLFLRMRILGPLIHVFNPDYLLNEKRLLEQVSGALTLKEVKDEIDFYHHKFVVSNLFKDAFRFRLSGYRLLSLASKLFARDQQNSAATD